MPHTLDDLTEVMEDRSARGRPSPDLLPLVRRRIRRGGRRRAVAGAVGAALAAGTLFGVGQEMGDTSVAPGRKAAPLMAGVDGEAFTRSSSKYGMRPVREVRYSTVGRKARFQFTPAGRHSMITYRCSSEIMVYRVDRGVLSGGGCSGGGSAEAYLQTTAGVPITFEVVALPLEVTPQGPQRPWTVAELDRFLGAYQPLPGNWRVQAYSGECTISTCYGPPAGRPKGGGRS